MSKKRKPILIDDDLHSRCKEFAAKHKMPLVKFSEQSMEFFISRGVPPDQIEDIKNLKDVLISFIRKQEQIFHKPNKDNITAIIEELKNLNYMLKVLHKNANN